MARLVLTYNLLSMLTTIPVALYLHTEVGGFTATGDKIKSKGIKNFNRYQVFSQNNLSFYT